jgi:ferredoxin/coenzyme F420-reducing hydrogenase delta subunit
MNESSVFGAPLDASGAARSEPPPPRRRLPVVPGAGASARVEPPVRGERVLRAAEAVLLRVDRAVDRALPEALNPFAQTGAIASTTLLVAVASGILLLVFYSSSVHEAYASVRAMDGARFGGGFVRSLHRYSSDACMLFVLLHALRLSAERRFGGARWLAWVTGLALLGTLWFVGWLGYWLVWDERARQVALGTARLLDALPVFLEPLSRSFLTDDGVSSLLFFVVFFVHMLVPLAMGVVLWLHITRLSRPWFLTGRAMTAWVLASLVLLSVVLPADTAAPARMGVVPSGFRMDGWFLLPLGLTDRLGAGALWAIVLVGGAVLASVPWTLAKGRARVAVVNEARCNACENCYHDCPYDAISMGPRTDQKKAPARSIVDPDKCVGCGICAGSCDAAAIGLPWFDVLAKRADLDRWVDGRVAREGSTNVAFVCGESAGGELSIDPQTGACAKLPGWAVMRVPCAGWVQPLTVARALRHGATSVLVVACGPGTGTYREGGKWTHERMSARREPKLDLAKVDPARVRVLERFRGDVPRLVREAAALCAGAPALAHARRPPTRYAAGALLALGLSAGAWGASRARYALPPHDAPELVVSFSHPGQVGERCRDLTEDEKRKLPPHMRPPRICERGRVPVRLRVEVDGRAVIEKAYAPSGLWGDGVSLAMERLTVPAGAHTIRVAVGDGPDATVWEHRDEKVVDLAPRSLTVVRFDKLSGFEWR